MASNEKVSRMESGDEGMRKLYRTRGRRPSFMSSL